MAGAILLDEAKTYLRIDDDEENAVIQGLIDAAARHIETTYGVVSLAREESFIFDGFAAQIRVPRVPVDPGNISVTFLDTDGVVQNLEGVRAIERDGWVWLHPALGSRWPGRVAAVGSVTITASVGYAEGAAPDDVKQATRMIVDHWYSERDFSSPAANVDFLIDHYRFRRV